LNLKKELPGIKENVSLADYTTFRIGGEARYFYTAKDKEKAVKALLLAKELNLPFFVLGGGSNILIADDGFKGLVVSFQFSDIDFKDNKIFCGAGLSLALLLSEAAKKGLSGLEWGAGIPGTVGGAIRGNSGAFGDSMVSAINKVEVFNLASKKTENYSQEDCSFDYRESVFKRRPELVILSAELELKKGDKKEIKEKMKECMDYRQETQPLGFPSAGSIFKNPPDMPAGQLIEKCGLKGKKIGGAQISEKHANFIVNVNQAKAADVIHLIELAKQEVMDRFNVNLEEEIQYLGF